MCSSAGFRFSITGALTWFRTSNVWIGLEYFCNRRTPSGAGRTRTWRVGRGRAGVKSALSTTRTCWTSLVLRVEKTYPAYFGTYDRFDEIRDYVDGFENLFLIGRNGMHWYNNQDHSMLTAMTAVDNIIAGRTDKANIWEVNTEAEYHEEKHSRKIPQ